MPVAVELRSHATTKGTDQQQCNRTANLFSPRPTFDKNAQNVYSFTNLSHLKYFCKICDSQTLSKLAAKLVKLAAILLQ